MNKINNIIKVDFHIHTSTSPDGMGNIMTRIKKAKKVGLDMIAITDHNTINPIIRGKKIIEKNGVKLLVGEEVSTDKGEVIGLFLKKPIKPGKLEHILEEIKSQEGIVILPHPFKRSRVVYYPEILDNIDFIEVWNGRTSFEENYKSLIFATLNKKYISCGSDAHFPFEIGRSILEIPVKDIDIVRSIETSDNLLDLVRYARRFIIKGKSNRCFLLESLSQLVKFIRNKKIKTLKNSLVFALLDLVRAEEYKYVEIEVCGEVCTFKFTNIK